jgi:hypothetical protein
LLSKYLNGLGLLSLFLVSLPGGKVFADNHSVKVAVRSIHASQPLNGARKTAKNEISVDSRLSDLKPQLQALNFAKFKLMDRQDNHVELKRKAVMHLAGGHTLTIRPLYANSQKIGLWLHWVDQSGMEMLDTRMHFKPGQTMMAGAESTENCGRILAINVKQSKN